MNSPLALMDIYGRLLESYGPQDWWPADSPFEVMVGAVLTQNTSWSGAERAIGGLKMHCGMTPEDILTIPEEKLRELIRPSGYFRQKAGRLRGLCRFLADGGGGRGLSRFGERPTEELRERLLALTGIGPETADSILLYALDRPVFVVDAYTVRLLGRLGVLPGKGAYGEVQELFMEGLPAEAALYNEYHALIVIHGKERCRKRDPLCEGCPLYEVCGFGQSGELPGRSGGTS